MRNVLVIAGPGGAAFGNEQITKLTNNVKSDLRTIMCIGNGNDKINNTDISNKLEDISENEHATTVIIYMHGTDKNGQFYFVNGDSYVSSKELFGMIGSRFENSAVDIVIVSCHSGACLRDKDLLPEGSIIGTFSQGHQLTAGPDVERFIDSLSEDKEDLTAFHLMQKYMSGLENRMPPEMGISGKAGSIQFDELLRQSIGKKFDREKIASLIGKDITTDNLNSIIDKIETAKYEWNIWDKEYGKALAICSASEFGDSLSKDNFKSIQGSQKSMNRESAMGLFIKSDKFSTHRRRQLTMNWINKLNSINKNMREKHTKYIEDGKEV